MIKYQLYSLIFRVMYYMNKEKFNKELSEIKRDPESYLKNRKVKIDLLWYLASVLGALAVGIFFF